MTDGKSMFSERRLSTLAAGSIHSFSEGVKSLNINDQPSNHPVGAIGSSRPGSRIAQLTQAPFGQVPSHVANQPLWAEAERPRGSVTSQKPSSNIDHSSSEAEVSNSSGGYGLSSSMWAAPASTGTQSHFPHQDHLHTPGFPTNVSVPLSSDFDTKPTSLRSEPGIPFVKQAGSPAGQMSNTLHPSPELPLARFDNPSSLDSPALSFSQTGSAPSTGGSYLPSDVSPPHARNGLFNGYSMPPSDEHSPYGLAIKQFDAACPSGHNNFAIDKILSEPPWPLAMSFGEEAFYSKSNVTKPKNPSVETGSAATSPGLWRPLDVSLPLSHHSPSNGKPSASLASPLMGQPHTSGVLGQLLSRVEQLERKTVKQEQEIQQMKAKISLMGAQSLREHQVNPTVPSGAQSSANFPSHVPTGNAFPTSVQTRLVPLANPTVMNNNVNVAADHAGAVANGHSGPPNNASHPRPEEASAQNALPANSTLNSGFRQRQFGPLDYSVRRVTSIAPGATLMQQPLQAPAPLHNTPPTNGPGIVNYRALLSGDTECDYEYFIRRITKHNDQQASIFLQQKLKQSALAQSAGGDKNEPTETRHTGKPRKEITRLVIDLSWELMTNRFGNFLVSRAIEHATYGERLQLAKRISGQIVTLAQDTFATHCLQKMIDVDEEGENHVRRMISEELLKKKETVTHKSAGHVWARLLSVGGGSSSTISLSTGTEKATGLNQYGDGAGKSGGLERSLNQLLRGEWATTAKDEVGSLIVQSVLENWDEASKADVVEELLADIYSCAVQQWGNFVILHLIEHSTGAIQKKLFQRLTETQLACELSIDNFGAKAIEKVLKVSGMESSIVEDYVKAICEYGHGRPALIDIACHQAGAQVLTLLFTSAPNSIRDLMIQTVRRNGVTMKSSKAGSKIWFLVERTRAWVGH